MEKYVLNILDWYQKNKRELPWRKDKEPYHVWISEIMLQQTRIEAVIGYYERFMKKLPDISSLACVKDDVLLKLWEGLGYYNRAHNLKKAAIIIMEEYEGKFPTTYEEIIKLPGIGDYTASAIASICFNEKQVTVDGNVMRVFTRFYNDDSNISKPSTKKMIHDKLLSFCPSDSGDFNEGLMELGEKICLPNGVPKCEICPLRKGCLANQNGNYFLYPAKAEKKTKEIVPMTVFLLIWNKKVFIQKRGKRGLLHNLYEFPNVIGIKDEKEVVKIASKYGDVSSIKSSIQYTHVFTHKKWQMQAYVIFLKQVLSEDMFYSTEDIENNFALPSAFQPFLFQLKEEEK